MILNAVKINIELNRYFTYPSNYISEDKIGQLWLIRRLKNESFFNRKCEFGYNQIGYYLIQIVKYGLGLLYSVCK